MPELRLAISIHAPHARSDGVDRKRAGKAKDFNPRSSCEERLEQASQSARQRHFNPRSSCEERQVVYQDSEDTVRISIHAPHARSDNVIPIDVISYYNFNPRSSCEERHVLPLGQGCADHISIHAPHARSDSSVGTSARSPTYFNPRSSCEERRAVQQGAGADAQISIHAPHARSDMSDRYILPPHEVFQSTLLMRGATLCWRSIAA